MLDYGVLVFRGEGVQQSEKIGAQWLLLSAKRGNIIAQNRVARLYAFGKGFPANPVEAMKWNILASRGGRGDAELDTILSTLPEAEKAKAVAAADAFKPADVKIK
jgi:TPR repeat protein